MATRRDELDWMVAGSLRGGRTRNIVILAWVLKSVPSLAITVGFFAIWHANPFLFGAAGAAFPTWARVAVGVVLFSYLSEFFEWLFEPWLRRLAMSETRRTR